MCRGVDCLNLGFWFPFLVLDLLLGAISWGRTEKTIASKRSEAEFTSEFHLKNRDCLQIYFETFPYYRHREIEISKLTNDFTCPS